MAVALAPPEVREKNGANPVRARRAGGQRERDRGGGGDGVAVDVLFLDLVGAARRGGRDGLAARGAFVKTSWLAGAGRTLKVLLVAEVSVPSVAVRV